MLEHVFENHLSSFELYCTSPLIIEYDYCFHWIPFFILFLSLNLMFVGYYADDEIKLILDLYLIVLDIMLMIE